jgi:hypothetical protein
MMTWWLLDVSHGPIKHGPTILPHVCNFDVGKVLLGLIDCLVDHLVVLYSISKISNGFLWILTAPSVSMGDVAFDVCTNPW